MRHNFRQLKIWEKVMDLVILTYAITSKFPSDERFGLISQINRCSVSIPSNIAEGTGKSTDKDFAYFLSHSFGSLYELETQIIISFKLKYLSENSYNDVIEQIFILEKMIVGFIKNLNS
ncbi:MAG: four helix bundle protein [Cytophagales bacterium]